MIQIGNFYKVIALMTKSYFEFKTIKN